MNLAVQIKSQRPGSMSLVLEDPNLLDGAGFFQNAASQWALPCLIQDEKTAEIVYSTGQLIPLSDFLEQTEFEKEEAYRFIGQLIEKMIFTGRSMALFTKTEGIYVSARGDEVYFAGLPVNASCWPFFKQESIRNVMEIACRMKCVSAYEIIGYLLRCQREQKTLAEMVCGLQDLQKIYCPRPFWKRSRKAKPQGYIAKKPAEAMWNKPSRQMTTLMEEEVREQTLSRSRYLDEMEKAPGLSAYSRQEDPHRSNGMTETYGCPAGTLAFADLDSTNPLKKQTGSGKNRERKPEDFDEMKTEILLQAPVTSAFLEVGDQRFTLQSQICEIGRHVSCQIRLEDPSVSLHHARITCDNDRYYLSNLKSTNGTWLNDQKVIRRMRLRQGMVLQFGNTQAVFHE